MPKYKVREGENIIHDNEQYGPGDVLTCTEKQAALLRVDLIEEKQKDGERGTKDEKKK